MLKAKKLSLSWARKRHSNQLLHQKEKEEELASYELALSLQKEEQRLAREHQPIFHQDCQNMDMSWKFVAWIIDLHEQLSESSVGSNLIETIGADDIVFTAKKFMECRDFFRTNGICSNVSLGFHYTKQRSLDKIKQDGLMSGAERSNPKALSFGDGEKTVVRLCFIILDSSIIRNHISPLSRDICE